MNIYFAEDYPNREQIIDWFELECREKGFGRKRLEKVAFANKNPDKLPKYLFGEEKGEIKAYMLLIANNDSEIFPPFHSLLMRHNCDELNREDARKMIEVGRKVCIQVGADKLLGFLEEAMRCWG